MSQNNVDNVTATRSQGSIVGTVTRTQAAWFGVQLQAKAGDSPFLQNLRNGSEAHPASYYMDTALSVWVMKLTLSSGKIKKE